MRWPFTPEPGTTRVATAASANTGGARARLLPITRLEAFSDAVLAIAITLLVLELHVPAGNEALVKGLEHEWPRCPFTMAIAANHLFPSFLPFADHTVTRADLPAEQVAVVIFGLNLTMAALMRYVMIRHARRTCGLAADDTAQEELRASRWRC